MIIYRVYMEDVTGCEYVGPFLSPENKSSVYYGAWICVDIGWAWLGAAKGG